MNLDELFKQFNAKYFESRLPIFSVECTEDLRENSMGHLDCENRRILIRKSLCNSQQEITLLHEMIHIQIKGHGIDFQTKLDRCAGNSSSDFRQVILSELQYVRDIDRFGRSRCAASPAMWSVLKYKLRLPSSCPSKVDESSFPISPDQLSADSISDIIDLGYIAENLHLKKTD